MTRPGGVTASAVVSLIGSACTLVFAGLMLLAAFSENQQGPHVRGIAIGMALFASGLAGLGVWTAIGLFRLRSWARISILVFAGVMAATSLLSGLVLAIVPVPTPPEMPRTTAATMRWVLVGVYAVPFLIGVWWLVLFNKRTTKDAFAGEGRDVPGQASQRPLSVSIIGWWNVVGGVLGLVTALTGMPAFIAGVILQGWSARLFYLLFGAVAVYLGWGLLKLQERARVLTLVWFGFGAPYAAYMAFTPSARARLREFTATMQLEQTPRQAAFDSATFTSVMMLFTLAFIAVAAWFLVRNKPAFDRKPAESGPDLRGGPT